MFLKSVGILLPSAFAIPFLNKSSASQLNKGKLIEHMSLFMYEQALEELPTSVQAWLKD
jgi:hypothetical protein